ncbi:hypothetical protein [Campylobacter phage CP39]|nr:hypothetical protein [Campylobacter phage CP39]
MKLLVAGSRDFNDYNLLKNKIFELNIQPSTIVCGMTRGADMLGYQYGIDNSLKIEKYKPNWNLYGKSAGPIRNKLMADSLNRETDMAIIFWDGISKGSKNMISILDDKKINYKIIYYKEKENE